MATLFTINPSRRKSRSGKKRRSSKQRAATRRMLAARWGRNPMNPKKRRGRPRKSAVARKSRRRSSKRGIRRYARRGTPMRLTANTAINLLKAGAIGGAGAVLVDIGMGFVGRMLPAALATPADASGNIQYGYFAGKAAIAMALGTFGGQIMPPAIAEKMGEGALTVLAYQFIRPMVPAGLALGYFNPAPTMRPQMGRTGAYVRGAGAYPALPIRNGNAVNNGKGGRAANVLSMVNVARRAA